jgi:hypothetical protein
MSTRPSNCDSDTIVVDGISENRPSDMGEAKGSLRQVRGTPGSNIEPFHSWHVFDWICVNSALNIHSSNRSHHPHPHMGGYIFARHRER